MKIRIVFFLLIGLFLGCDELSQTPPAAPAPPPPPQPDSSCNPQTQDCPEDSDDPSENTGIDPVDYFTITNILPPSPNEAVQIIYDNKTVDFPIGQCAKVHKTLYTKVNLYLIKDGKKLRICRPEGQRARHPDAGTQTYGCRGEGPGFGYGDVLNYKLENTDSVTADDSQSLPETCKVIVR